jgi:hypothetical protein
LSREKVRELTVAIGELLVALKSHIREYGETPENPTPELNDDDYVKGLDMYNRYKYILEPKPIRRRSRRQRDYSGLNRIID